MQVFDVRFPCGCITHSEREVIFDNFHSWNKLICLIYWNIDSLSYIVILTKDRIYVIFSAIFTVIFSTTWFPIITLTLALSLAPELPIKLSKAQHSHSKFRKSRDHTLPGGSKWKKSNVPRSLKELHTT